MADWLHVVHRSGADCLGLHGRRGSADLPSHRDILLLAIGQARGEPDGCEFNIEAATGRSPLTY